MTQINTDYMKIKFCFAFLGLAFELISCTSSQISVQDSRGFQMTPRNAEEKLALEIHREVNRVRAAHGFSALEFHGGLGQMSQGHSRYMRDNVGKFSVDGTLITHYGIDGRRVLAEKKYRIEELSENVIASFDLGQDTALAPKMVRGWMTSPNHRANILAKWSLSGVGVAFDGSGRAFVTQSFGSSPSQALTVGGPNQW